MTQREADREKNEETDKSEYKKTKTSVIVTLSRSGLCFPQDDKIHKDCRLSSIYMFLFQLPA